MLHPFSHSVCCEKGCTLCVSLVPHFIFLRNSRARETRARVKITLHEKRRYAALGVIFTRARVSFALLSLRKIKWGTRETQSVQPCSRHTECENGRNM